MSQTVSVCIGQISHFPPSCSHETVKRVWHHVCQVQVFVDLSISTSDYPPHFNPASHNKVLITTTKSSFQNQLHLIHLHQPIYHILPHPLSSAPTHQIDKIQFSAITTFALLGSALAAPAPIEQRGLTESVGLIVDTLNATVTQNLGQITNLVSGVKNNVEASVQVAAQVGADFQAIAAALTTAAQGITAATVTGIGGLSGQLLLLSDTQIKALAASLAEAQALVKQIGVTITLTTTNLAPIALQTIQAELDAAAAAVIPFVGPLTKFATAVANAQLGLSAAVTGLQKAVIGLVGILGNLLAGLL
ncbi:hypothetical protein ONS95_011702 [Cadophora gregata]|uniref:uncharacterized protein n=1 Tax=Cadophora gregata TaxID=51156 RepID=UPI0026DAA5D2|nr:uncharacterized protein ONS95_011702 [Cadophora gregata]KAK0120296.1 hypothetical protein ONS95_011702 [Cadophora gregata]KAK0121329.1 hypothetical protein ONS96_011504 [Cadophora gregata f. sp. sojae]